MGARLMSRCGVSRGLCCIKLLPVFRLTHPGEPARSHASAIGYPLTIGVWRREDDNLTIRPCDCSGTRRSVPRRTVVFATLPSRSLTVWLQLRSTLKYQLAID